MIAAGCGLFSCRLMNLPASECVGQWPGGALLRFVRRLRHRSQRHDQRGIDEPLEMQCEGLGE